MPAPGSFNRFVSRKELSQKLGEGPRSTARRQASDPQFPFTFYINGHAFHTDTGVDEYLQLVMRRGLQARGTYPANPKGTGRPRKSETAA
jgi:hypothetical protein